ncbi:MAG: hypothetical protein AAGA02_10040 [Bacteroidota bacterium]
MLSYENDISPFNEEFCIYLEYQLCYLFEYHNHEDLRGYWCDGVSFPMPDYQLTKKHVNDKRRIITKAWIGEDGQDEYEMTVLFGKYSLRRYARGTSLVDCIPDYKSMDWIEMDIDEKTIQIRLR